jgi:DNA polymerase III gamma/tau subunit
MPLHITHRPSKLSEVFGNSAIVDSLQTIMSRKKDFPHAILLHGPTGCGKTTIARIIGTMLGASPESIEEYNMANTRGIDTIRAFSEACIYMPLMGDVRVYIFDEIHRQTKDAQNALLKMLEDPPDHVFIILCTTDPEQLLPTIRGRCHTYQVKPLKSDEMMALLKSVLIKEKIDNYPDKILKEISFLSDGHPRNALVMLDSVIDMEDEETALASLSTVSDLEVNTKEICQALLYGNKTWEDVRDSVKKALLVEEPERIRQGILGYMTNTVLGDKTSLKVRKRARYVIDIFSENIFYNGRSGIVKMVSVVMEP